jgi:hypothetical protein
MTKTKTCEDCLYCTGPVDTPRTKYLCVFTCEPTQPNAIACAHHCPKTGVLAFIRRCCNLLVLRETRPLENGWKPETIAAIMRNRKSIAEIVYEEEYDRPKE